MNRVKLPYLLGSLFIVAAFVAILGATLVSPGFVEANLSPDNDLAGSTVQTINTLRTVAGLVSLALVFAGLTTLAYARYERLRSSTNALFASVILPLIRPIRRLPFWSLPLVLALLVLPLKGVTTSPDTATYLSQALDIYQGEGYDNVQRGPILPGLIALSFIPFGVSVATGLLTIRICFLFTVMLSYAIGNRLGNKWSGLIASLLVLSSGVLNTTVYSYILPDAMVAVFILLFIYTIIRGMETGLIRWHLAAGASLALAYLTKEMALLLFPLPLIVLFISKTYRQRKYRVGTLAFYAALLVTILPWAIYVYSLSGSLIGLIGKSGMNFIQEVTAQAPNPAGARTNMFVQIQQLFEALRSYYTDIVAQQFALSPLFLLTWAALAIRSVIYRKPLDLLIIIAILLFAPLMLFLGQESLGWPARHSVAVFLLTYVALAYLLTTMISALYSKASVKLAVPPQSKIIRHGILTIVTIIALSIQVVGERDMLRLWTGNSVGAGLQVAHGMSYYRGTDFKLGGWHNPHVKSAATWLREHSSDSTSIISDWFEANSLEFFMQHEVKRFSYVTSDDAKESQNNQTANGRPLFVWTKSTRPGATVYVATERNLMEQLKHSEAEFVVTTLRRNFLSIYFSQHSGYVKEAGFGNGRIKIYKVHNISPIDAFKPHFTVEAMKMMYEWSRENQSAFESFVNSFMIDRIGIEEEVFTPPQTEDEFRLIRRFTIYN